MYLLMDSVICNFFILIRSLSLSIATKMMAQFEREFFCLCRATKRSKRLTVTVEPEKQKHSAASGGEAGPR